MAALLDEARGVYHDDPAALEAIAAMDRRLQEPLRIAVAGIVKAGKSTLLNALIGEKIAPTDAGECTRTVTWYRYARTPKVTLRLLDGTSVRLPVRRSAGALELDFGRYTADDVDWVDVEWPSEHLRRTVLIDTPGIGSLSTETSARSTRFLTPRESPSEADAIIYLLRHLHATDVRFLEAFRDTAAGQARTVNAVAVLSRADEIGSGRIDSLISAARIADRYRRDGELRALALGVVPVAGLLAEAARTLRESEFIALRSLAGLDRAVRDRALLSADRFLRPGGATTLSLDVRRALLARFGIFGVRLGAALVRAGAHTSSELSERLVQQSGLIELERFVGDQFRGRAVAFKTQGVLRGLETLVRERRGADAASLRGGIERLWANAREFRELELISLARTTVLPLSPEECDEAERLAGGSGTAAHTRLGLAEAEGRPAVRERVATTLAHWHGVLQSPMADRLTVEVARVVVRSTEGAAAELLGSEGVDEARGGAEASGEGTPVDAGTAVAAPAVAAPSDAAASPSADGPAPHVVPPGRPPQSRREHAAQQREH
ncbi:dynamin family protein [Microbacterium fluvii]|uniref:Dynamin family protein n=1 Tax=Microbacterium fluvii TaxID=415215 RepID=A0ABW2H920_9MICO|nr:dynamin family protein [Microbacterium fluvii]MCU4671228.1 dynamin family protein [Microbacterium fluvii]